MRSVNRVHRGAVAVAGAAAIILTMAPTAFAEGSFSSSISGAMTGFNSRWWTKQKNYDASTVINFKNCWASGPDTSTTVQLTKYKSGPLPDENRGQKTFTACFGGGTSSGNWGTQRGGGDEYRFAIMKINGSTSGYSLNVSSLSVSY
ncbi:hypothetical protein ACPXCE_18600 [Streptomyces sp. DT24]|uniref:hypothetical protein n=1 Tax=unclassified Streptomyces TaxID=2593676 RepID=UPI0023BA3874|nr:hypothetical protein [Streptomyces sp. AM 4-1-1]WEH34083.1 hypothetical protein PZB75_12325 [Streptomyces sp. AM 4-1-1]